MKCSQVQKKLSAYLDSEISVKEKELIEEHMRNCPECCEEIAFLTELGSTLNTVEEIEVPAYFRTRVKQRIKDQSSMPIPIAEKIRRVIFPLAATAALVTSLLLGNYIGRSLYQNITETTVQENSEIAGTLGFSSFNEFPEGSLSDVFYDYVPGGDK